MKKFLIIGLVVLAGLWFVGKRVQSSVCASVERARSYAGAFLAQVQEGTNGQEEIKADPQEIRKEIGNLDGDIRRMVSPIAEHMAFIDQLQKEIDATRGNLATQKDNLLALTDLLKKEQTAYVYRGRKLPAERLRTQLDREFATFKTQQATLESKEKLLEAKERTLDATKDQLNKLIAKKRDFEVRLAQLEAEEARLSYDRLATLPDLDDHRATQIQAALDKIAHRQLVEKNRIKLMPQYTTTSDNLPAPESRLSPDEIRAYLQGNGNGVRTAKSE
jgi:peptidoglycan hydrolase CwlO-like protein